MVGPSLQAWTSAVCADLVVNLEREAATECPGPLAMTEESMWCARGPLGFALKILAFLLKQH